MKFKGKCFIYNKLHIKQNITKISLNKFFFKKGTVTQANVAEIDNLQNKVLEISLFMGVFKMNMINYHEQWWIDNSATRLVCAKIKMFFTYNEVDGEQM